MMSSPVRVLVVDDEESIRESMAEFLDDYDYDVASAESAEEALTLLVGTPCDVAVVDLRLPGISGDAFILEAHSKWPAMRFLIHTGSVNFHITEKLKGIGMSSKHVYIKPQPDLIRIVKGIEDLVRDPPPS